MLLFWFKTAAATFLLGAGLIAARAMLKVLGTAGFQGDPAPLRKRHKTAARWFGIALAVLAGAGFYYWARTGDSIPDRAVIHLYFAMALAAIYLLKLVIARRYRQYLRYAAPIGLTLATLMVVVYAGSAGYFVLHAAIGAGDPVRSEAPSAPSADAERGRRTFERLCSACHFADREERKTGPGLKGILKRAALPASGRPATVENVLDQLEKPFRTMPSFRSLSALERADLIAYLQTL